MNLDVIFQWLAGLNPIVSLVLHILGTLVVLGTVYVKLTPSVADDAWFVKLENMPIVGLIFQELINFSYVQRKDPPASPPAPPAA